MKFIVGFTAVLSVFLSLTSAQEPPAGPVTSSVQIVNATCVPQITLYVNKKPVYPQFAQGLYTGDGALPYATASYQALCVEKKLASTPAHMRFAPSKTQTMLITGDFSKTDPPDDLPQPEATPAAPRTPAKEYDPNIQFRILSNDLEEGEKRLRYRFFNAIPRKIIAVKPAGTGTSTEVLPGHCHSLTGQKLVGNYTVTVDGQDTDVFINQQGHDRNCTIVFFLKEGRPAFMRLFESTPESNQRAENAEAEAR